MSIFSAFFGISKIQPFHYCHARMKEIHTKEIYYAINLRPMMKPLRLSSITQYTRTYSAMYTLEMKATMSYYFHSQRYECDYVLPNNVERKTIQASPNAIHATHYNPWIG